MTYEYSNNTGSVIYPYLKNYVLFTADANLANRLCDWKTTTLTIPQYSLRDIGYEGNLKLFLSHNPRPLPRRETSWYLHFNRRYLRRYAREAGIAIPKNQLSTAQKNAREANFQKIKNAVSPSRKLMPNFSNGIITKPA